LSLSREKPQDSSLLRRIKEAITRKLLRFFAEKLKNDFKSYQEFYVEYHMFLKEGVCQDYQFTDQLSKLLLFESSAKDEGELITLDDYISRCAPEQKDIYYIVAPNRKSAFASPYYETFKKHNKEVLLLYNTIDDFVMSNVREYSGRKLTSAETSTIDLSKEKKTEGETEKAKGDDKETSNTENGNVIALNDAEEIDFCAWLKTTLGDKKVRDVKVSKRLSDSPCIVTDHESGAMRRMMKMVEQANSGRSGANNDLPPQNLEINPSHPLIVELFNAKDNVNRNPHAIAEQLLDNALMAAGLIEDPRYMIPRLNEILLKSLKDA